jgi:hypothetical protein
VVPLAEGTKAEEKPSIEEKITKPVVENQKQLLKQ